MLSSLLILINDSLIQGMVAIYICLLAIKVYSYYEPYVDDDDDKLGEVSQVSGEYLDVGSEYFHVFSFISRVFFIE